MKPRSMNGGFNKEMENFGRDNKQEMMKWRRLPEENVLFYMQATWPTDLTSCQEEESMQNNEFIFRLIFVPAQIFHKGFAFP